jgi:hypothetical protein
MQMDYPAETLLPRHLQSYVSYARWSEVRLTAYRVAALTERGWANANLRTNFTKILGRIGVKEWNRLFHSMQASCQTDLEKKHPTHVVCAWLGNSEKVAKENYLLVTESDFEAARAVPADAPKVRTLSGAQDAKSRAKSGAASGGKGEQPQAKNQRFIGKTYQFKGFLSFTQWR